MLFVEKKHESKRYFLSTRAKTGFESFGYREYLRDQLLLRRKIMLCFPLWSIQGAWTRPKLWITRRKTAKSCPKLFISVLYLVYTLNKYHVNQDIIFVFKFTQILTCSPTYYSALSWFEKYFWRHCKMSMSPCAPLHLGTYEWVPI